jgi:hypothetical protein
MSDIEERADRWADALTALAAAGGRLHAPRPAAGPSDALRGAVARWSAFAGLMGAVLDRLAPPPPGEGLEHELGRLRAAVLKHPVAAQALYGGLIAEGRAWAETPDGAACAERLRRSPALARAWAGFEGATGRALDEGGAVPTRWLDLLLGELADPEAR